jgi:hypothetical protein
MIAVELPRRIRGPACGGFLRSTLVLVSLLLLFSFQESLNHTNLGTPDRFVNTPQFGTITEATTPDREIQLSARLSF